MSKTTKVKKIPVTVNGKPAQIEVAQMTKLSKTYSTETKVGRPHNTIASA